MKNFGISTVSTSTDMTNTNTTDHVLTNDELHNITLDAIRWEVRKATYMLLDVMEYFYMRPDQTYPDETTLNKIRFDYSKLSAELDIANGLLGRIYDLTEHDDGEDDGMDD